MAEMAEVLDRLDHDEVDQPVRRIGLAAAHEIERVAGDVARRHVLAERRRHGAPRRMRPRAAGRGHRGRTPGPRVIEKPRSTSPRRLSPMSSRSSRLQRGVDRGAVEELDVVAAAAHTVHAVAQALVRAALQRERTGCRRSPRHRCRDRSCPHCGRSAATPGRRRPLRRSNRARARRRGTRATLDCVLRPVRSGPAIRDRCCRTPRTRRGCRR